MDVWEVKCPGCAGILIIDRKTGKLVEHRAPILAEGEATGDRFEDARKKVLSSGDRIEDKVAEVRKAQKDKLAKLDALFKERKKEIEDSGLPVEKPDDLFRD